MLIDCDSHLFEPGDVWVRYADPAVECHPRFLCNVAARWCCSGWPTAPSRSV